jgi:hypothetical protein
MKTNMKTKKKTKKKKDDIDEFIEKLNSFKDDLDLKLENYDKDHDFLPSGGYIMRKVGKDYEIFPEDQLMWRSQEDFKIFVSFIVSMVMIAFIIVFFYIFGHYFNFGFGSAICSVFFAIVGAWHEFSMNNYKIIKTNIRAGIYVGFIIGMILYDILYPIYK